MSATNISEALKIAKKGDVIMLGNPVPSFYATEPTWEVIGAEANRISLIGALGSISLGRVDYLRKNKNCKWVARRINGSSK